MPVTAAVAAANAVNAANGPFPAYMSSSGGSNGPAPGPPPGPGNSNSNGKQDGSSVDSAILTAEPDVPMSNLAPASVASEPLGGASDRIDYSGAQLLDVPVEDHEAHTHSHVSHHGEEDDEPQEEPQSKRNLALWSAVLALGGTSVAAAITAIAIRPRILAK